MGDYPELAALMEGEKSPWRHPYFGNREVWADQAAHPYFKPAVEPRLPLVRVAVIAAVVETTDAIAL